MSLKQDAERSPRGDKRRLVHEAVHANLSMLSMLWGLSYEEALLSPGNRWYSDNDGLCVKPEAVGATLSRLSSTCLSWECLSQVLQKPGYSTLRA